MGIDITAYLNNTDWSKSNKGISVKKKTAKEQPPPRDEVVIPKPKRGELYSINELRTKFQLSDEFINECFDEFYHNIGWINI